MPKNKASKALINSMKMPERGDASGLFNRKVVNGKDNDSYYAENPTSATFSVVVDGKTEFDSTRWTEVSGLSFTVSVVEHQEGGENGFVHKFPGPLSFPNITLTRGVTPNDGFHEWIKSIEPTGNAPKQRVVPRFNVSINLLSARGTDILRTWTLRDAFPISWTGPSFTASSDNYLTEQLVLAHHGFTVETKERPKPQAKKNLANAYKKAAQRQAAMLIERQKNQARHAVREGVKEEAAAAASALGGDEVKKAFDATY